MTQLICVDPAEIHKVWPSIRHGVWISLMKGIGGVFEWLERDILTGTALVWLAVDSEQNIRCVCVTQLEETDQGRKCFIRSLSGHGMREWFEHLPKIEEFARDEGCHSVQVEGRKGWLRILKDYEQTGVVMQKELH